MEKGELEIDILVGADYLCSFQKDCTIRGSLDDTVAVETELGWVLSGPMKSQSKGPEPVQINLVKTEDKESLDVDVNRLWDLEVIGIKEPRRGVYDCRDSISFDGHPYSVKLPWKEGCPDLPTNYTTSLQAWKGSPKFSQNMQL